MSYINDFVYEESNFFDCDEGENLMCIKKVEEATTRNGNRMIVVYCNVKTSNGEQFRHYLVEGPYFNKSLSRFMDCFGIPINEVNPASWINKIGKAYFDHWKFNSTTKEKEVVAEIQCHLLKKQGFSQPVPMQTAKAEEPVYNTDMPEDFPF